MRCSFDLVKPCLVGQYEWCINCEKFQNRQLEKQNSRVYTRGIKECMMCKIVNAESSTIITAHHVVPKEISKAQLGVKATDTVYLCEAHHKLFNELIRPIITIMTTKLYGETKKNYILYDLIPKSIERAKDLVEVLRP